MAKSPRALRRSARCPSEFSSARFAKRYAARARSRRRDRGGRGSRVNTHHLDRIRSSASPSFSGAGGLCEPRVDLRLDFLGERQRPRRSGERGLTTHARALLVNRSVARASLRRGRPIPSGAMSSALPPVSRRRAGRHPPRAPRRASPRRRARARLRRETVPPAAVATQGVLFRLRVLFGDARARGAPRRPRALGDAKDARAEEDAEDPEDVEDGASPTAPDSAPPPPATTPRRRAFVDRVFLRRVLAPRLRAGGAGQGPGHGGHDRVRRFEHVVLHAGVHHGVVVPRDPREPCSASPPRSASPASAWRWCGRGRAARKSQAGFGVARARRKMDEGIKSVCAKTGWAYKKRLHVRRLRVFPGERGVLQHARGSQGGARVTCSRERTYPSIVVHHDVFTNVVFLRQDAQSSVSRSLVSFGADVVRLALLRAIPVALDQRSRTARVSLERGAIRSAYFAPLYARL